MHHSRSDTKLAMFSSLAAAWFSVVFTAGVLVVAVTADDLACAETSDIARLEVLTAASDPDVTYLGWSLICDASTTVWKTTIQDVDTWHFESSCIDMGSTCEFRISSSTNTFYSLTYGAATIARSTEHENSTQKQEKFCFGPQCSKDPLVRLGDSTQGTIAHGENDVMWKYFLTRKSFVLWLLCVALSIAIATGILCARCSSSEPEDDEKTVESYDSGVVL